MATMQEIEIQTKKFSEARADLAAHVGALEDEKRSLVRKYLAGIKRRVAAAKVEREALHVLIAESAALFAKPRSQAFHGVRVGYRKANGKIEFDNAERVVELVRKHFKSEFETLVNVTYKPNKEALEKLDASDLKKLGVTVEATGDVVFIKEAATEVDKLVKALLEDETEEE